MIDSSWPLSQEINHCPKDSHKWVDCSIPATNALDRLECTRRQERTKRTKRTLRESVYVQSLVNESWPKQARIDILHMSDLHITSRTSETSIDFPHISWIPDHQDSSIFSRLASKRSASYSDALTAPLHSTAVTSWSTSSLLGKRTRTRTSKKLSCQQQQQRLVRSIALDADLSSLLALAQPQSHLDSTHIVPLRETDNRDMETTPAEMELNVPKWLPNTVHTAAVATPHAHSSNCRGNDSPRPFEDSELECSSPFLPRNP